MRKKWGKVLRESNIFTNFAKTFIPWCLSDLWRHSSRPIRYSMEVLIGLGYVGLFIAAFLAGSFVPFSSEVVLAALLLKTDMNVWALLAVATIGNWLGEMTCYYIGHLGKLEWIERWTKVDVDKLHLWEERIKRYGAWIAFFSFVPIIGNVIAVGCGYFRCNKWLTALLMFIGKLIRYVVIVFGVSLV